MWKDVYIVVWRVFEARSVKWMDIKRRLAVVQCLMELIGLQIQELRIRVEQANAERELRVAQRQREAMEKESRESAEGLESCGISTDPV